MLDKIKKFFSGLTDNITDAIRDILILSLAVAFLIGAFPWTSEVQKRATELRDLGYSNTQISDQLCEEIDKKDGPYETGGIDGKYLDGSIAPKGILAGSESGSGSGANQKPTHSHDYKETSRVDATCVTKGKIVKTCSCGDTKTESIPITEHSYTVSKVVTATCIVKGGTEYICSGCGDVHFVETSYGDHIYTPSEGTDATCTEEGVKVTVCSVCGDTVTETIPVLGHKEDTVSVVKEMSTCEETGISQFLCSRCGIVLREEHISPKGHVKSELIREKEPTFAADGMGVYKCKECGIVLETVTLPKEDLPMAVFIVGGVAVTGAIVGITCIVIKGKKGR